MKLKTNCTVVLCETNVLSLINPCLDNSLSIYEGGRGKATPVFLVKPDVSVIVTHLWSCAAKHLFISFGCTPRYRFHIPVEDALRLS
jgi:hypothetical protein